MKIQVEGPCVYKGDIYRFTWDFGRWLGGAIESRLEESEAFIKKYGKDWRLTFGWNTGSRVKKPRLSGPFVDRKYKAMRCVFELPSFRYTSPDPKAYLPVLKQYLEELAAFLTRERVDTSRIERDTESLLKEFVSKPGMLQLDPHPYTFGTKDDPYGLKKKAATTPTPKPEAKAPAKFAKRKMPAWRIPKKIEKRVEQEGGMWEDERFSPILLTVMSGNSFNGRGIPLTWQIEFEPFDDCFAAVNEKITASGIEPDGDGWSEVIENEFVRRHPKMKKEFHSDSESSTCVIWVESEAACQKLIEVVWSLTQPASTASA